MRIIITGGSGQLGRSLEKALAGHDLVLIGRPDFDITKKKIIDQISVVQPDLVIHTAAKTDVDGCERDPASAYLVNAEGTNLVAKACAKCNAQLVYISTDYVFDGKKDHPYNEKDPPNPLNVYGVTKLAGEKFVQGQLSHYYIVRTAWLYGSGEGNFVKKVLRLANTPPIKMVTTQVGSPTNADDLALAINALIRFPEYGIYHLTNAGSCSRYEMAKMILESKNRQDVSIEPITVYPRPAPIPSKLVLENRRGKALGIIMRPWQEALLAYLQRI